MGRLDGNPTPGNNSGLSQFQSPTCQQPGFRPVNQAPETFDDAPPAFEFGHEENQQESYQNASPEKPKTMYQGLENQNDFQRTSKPPGQPGEPVSFPPTNTPQAVQFPPQNVHMPATRSPASGQPQAFPPPGADQVHSFSPAAEPVNFPPHQPAMFHQPNMAQFTPPVTNFSVPPANMNPSMGPHAIPGSPFGQKAQPGIPIPQMVNPPTEPWKSTLFDCMNDPENAIITACFPCITFGQIAEILDHGQTSCGTSGCLYGTIAFCIAIPCIMSCGYRTKLRNQFGLVESPAPDWIVHCFCEWCALCQEYRELKERGLDPKLGWQGNVMRQVQMTTMTPPMHPMMGR